MDQRAISIDPDEVAHNEPPHQDLCCLQILLFLSLSLQVLVIEMVDMDEADIVLHIYS